MQIPTTVSAVSDGTDAVATLNSAMYKSELIGLTINGAKGSRAEIYLGTQRIDATSRGESNTADYARAREIPAGMTVRVVWPKQAAKATECNATFVIDRT